MSKLVMITGASGSGKTRLSWRFESPECVLLPGDTVAHWAASRLSPYIHPALAWGFDYWDVQLRYCDAASAMRSAILDLGRVVASRHGGSKLSRMESGLPIVAEACLLAIPRFRWAFRDALQAAGCPVAEERLFFLDVPPDQIVRRVAHRIGSGARPGDLEIHEYKARERREEIRARVAGAECVTREDPDRLAADIAAFLGLPGVPPDRPDFPGD